MSNTSELLLRSLEKSTEGLAAANIIRDLERRLAESERARVEEKKRFAETASEVIAAFVSDEDLPALAKAHEEIAALRGQLDGVQKDAARYRWLRQHGADIDNLWEIGLSLDTAIDDAMEKGNEANGK